jgi:hypothetical protein
VTCVHGLHYLGDKLSLLTRAAGWLSDDGVFVADFDPSAVRRADGSSAARLVARGFRRAGARYDARTHRLSWRGRVAFDFGGGYLGADDGAGPTYTGQPGVASYYRWD